MSSVGVQSWWVKCGNCGLPHRITNLGRRKAIDQEGMVRHRTTVHEAHCFGWRVMGAKERVRWEHEGRPAEWNVVVRPEEEGGL